VLSFIIVTKGDAICVSFKNEHNNAAVSNIISPLATFVATGHYLFTSVLQGRLYSHKPILDALFLVKKYNDWCELRYLAKNKNVAPSF